VHASEFLYLLIGALLAYGQWHVLAHVVVPRLAAEKFITVSWSETGARPPLYRLRIRNKSAFRKIIDVEATGMLRLPKYDSSHPRRTAAIAIPMQDSPLMQLSPRRAWFFVFMPEEIPETSGRYLPQELQRAIHAPDVDLRDLLKLVPEANLRVYVTGYDAYSGARRVYTTDEYTESSFLERDYDRLPSWLTDLTHGLINRRHSPQDGPLGHGA
jgi:hypothetical protein